MDIHQNLKTLRQASGLTQQQAADRVGLTRQAISNYERGRTRPDVELLARLAEVYGADLPAVLYGCSREQRLLRALKMAVTVLLAGIFLLTLARSGLMLLLNHYLPPSLVAGAPQLLETRFTLLDFWELWAELAGVFSQVCCLVAAVCLYRFKRPPSPAWGATLFFAASAGTAICVLLPAFWDTVYTLPDYLSISVRTLLPVLVLLCFWCGLALWRKFLRKRG